MQKKLRKQVALVLAISMLCMSFTVDSIVQAEDVPTLEEQIYESNLKIYNEAATDQQTLQSYLQEEVAEDVKKEAQEVITGYDAEWDKLQAIHDWVANNIYYDWYGRAHDTVGSCAAEDVLKNKGTVCAGYANLTAAMCNAVGIPCKVVMGYALGADTVGYWTQDLVDAQIVNHAWNEAYVDGKWVILDTTWDSNNRNTESDATASFKNCNQNYFNPELDVISKTHKLVKRENAIVDASIDRKIDENLKLNISIKDNKIVFDWNVLNYGDSYELQYNIVDGDAYAFSYRTGKTGTCGSTEAETIVPHYEESLLLYNDCWPMYFRLRMVKNDGTIWYSNRIEYTLPSYKVTFMEGSTVVCEQSVYMGKSATPPNIKKEGYQLTWSGNYENVTSDVIVYAVWKKIETEKQETKPSSKEETTQETKKISKPKKVTALSVKNKKLKKLSITWKKQTNVAGYQVQIATKRNFKTNKKTKTVYTNQLTWSGLKKGKTYYVRVRSYNYDGDGEKQYGAWSTVKKIKVKK